MPALHNEKHEKFAQLASVSNKSKAYMQCGYNCKPEYASQNAYMLCKKHPEIDKRIEELKKIARSDNRHEFEDYIKFLDDIIWARGEFSGDNKPKLDHRINSALKAMKAQGFEGATNINVHATGGFQIIMHSLPKGEEEKNVIDITKKAKEIEESSEKDGDEKE